MGTNLTIALVVSVPTESEVQLGIQLGRVASLLAEAIEKDFPDAQIKRLKSADLSVWLED